MKVKIFSHSASPDGIGSIIIAKLAFENIDFTLCKDVEELNDKLLSLFADQDFKDYDQIFITDLCPSIDVLKIMQWDTKLRERVKIFDHHESAIEMLKEENKNYEFLTVKQVLNGKSCCGMSLFYDYLCNKNNISVLKNSKLEKFVELTRLHDTWEWKKENNIDAFNLDILLQKLGPYGYLYHFYLKCLKDQEFMYDLEEKEWINEQNIENEKKVLNFIKNIVVTKEKDYTYGAVIGLYQYRNILAEKLKRKMPELDVLILMAIDNNSVSFRALKEKPVLEIAKSFGGGGHEMAASCTLTKENEIKLLNNFLNRR